MGLVFGLLLSVQAFAKQSKDDDGGDKNAKKKGDQITMTGIDAFDSVFKQVGDIDHTLAGIEGQLRDGKGNLNTALDLKKGTTLSDGLAELQKRGGSKIKLATDRGAMPKLEAEDGVPTNVRNAVDAVNAMTANFGGSLDQLTSLAPDIEKLAKQSGKMPGRLVEEFKKSGNGGLFDRLFKLPKAAKALKGDIAVTTGLPDRAAGLSDRMNDILGTVEGSFGGHPTHHGSGGGDKDGDKGNQSGKGKGKGKKK